MYADQLDIQPGDSAVTFSAFTGINPDGCEKWIVAGVGVKVVGFYEDKAIVRFYDIVGFIPVEDLEKYPG